jgi:hypothetical protein
MDLKNVLDHIVNRMQRAKEKDLRPEIIPSPCECSWQANPSTPLMPGATLQDGLRVIQAAITIVYGKSLH